MCWTESIALVWGGWWKEKNNKTRDIAVLKYKRANRTFEMASNPIKKQKLVFRDNSPPHIEEQLINIISFSYENLVNNSKNVCIPLWFVKWNIWPCYGMFTVVRAPDPLSNSHKSQQRWRCLVDLHLETLTICIHTLDSIFSTVIVSDSKKSSLFCSFSMFLYSTVRFGYILVVS